MKFKCKCGSWLVAISRTRELYDWRMIEGDFPDVIEWVPDDLVVEHWRGQCEFCNKKWGPFYDLNELKQVMIREGVLK